MPRIEIIHGRDPDSACEFTVFVDGVRTDDYDITDLDPGRGWERHDWESYKQSALSTGSPAYLEALAAEFDSYGDSEYVEGSREAWVRDMAEDFLAKNEHAQGWEGDDTDDWEPDCDVLSQEFIEFCTKTYSYTPRLVHVRPPVETGEMYSDHWFVAFDEIAVDFTARQFYNVPQPPVDPDTIPIPLIFEWHGGVHADTYPLDYVTFVEVRD